MVHLVEDGPVERLPQLAVSDVDVLARRTCCVPEQLTLVRGCEESIEEPQVRIASHPPGVALLIVPSIFPSTCTYDVGTERTFIVR